jgi:aminoglycoside/choline kinase family phosphotransferase
VSAHEPAELERWLHEAVGARFPGARVTATIALKGDASARRFWRIAFEPGKGGTSIGHKDGGAPLSAIAIDLGPDDLPLYARALNLLPEPLTEPPWINVHRFLKSIGAAVPDVFAADTHARMLLVEDVGELPLFEAASRGDAGDLYRLAADELLVLHLEGTHRLDRRCIAARVAYDERLFRWELAQFVDYGVAEVTAASMSPIAIAPELDDLAARLGRYPRVLSHRDYHGNNLFLQLTSGGGPSGNSQRLRVIDFQDALMAPAAQDLAVLLTTRDAARIITPTIERRMLDYYFAAHLRRGTAMALTLDDFNESYRLCVLQHALKVIGRFIWLEQNGRQGYAAYVPYAIEQARRVLANRNDFANLRAALGA